MKKLMLRVTVLTAMIMMIASVALAAITREQAIEIVKNEYPDAVVYEVEYDHEDGQPIYEVKFRTDTVRKGEFEISVDTGNVISRKVKSYKR